MRDVEDWKREILKDIKVRAAYSALAGEFARARKKIKAKKGKAKIGSVVKRMRLPTPKNICRIR